MKEKVVSSNAPSTGASPHSQAIVANGFVFTQGMVCLTPEGKMLEGSFEDQLHQIMRNLQTILEEAGTSLENVVKATVYLTDMSHYQAMNEVYRTYFSDPYPAREAVCVKELPLGAQIEISLVATV